MKILIPEFKIQRAISDLAQDLTQFEGGRVDAMDALQNNHDKSPVFLGVLNGSFMFMADLVKHMEKDIYCDFVAVQSYDGQLQGELRMTKKPKKSLSNKRIYIVEDIVDTGNTIKYIKSWIESRYENTEIHVISMIKRKSDVSNNIDFYALEIGEEFIYGMGLDDNELKRNYRNIYEI